MNKLFVILTGIFLSISAYGATGRVLYVIDGDTFAAVVSIGDDIEVTTKIRILDIDAPEIKGKCESEINRAYLAKEKLQELLPKGSSITLDKLKDDKYLGRINAIVVNESGKNVSDVLMDSGLAVAYSGGKRISWCEK